jgi:hypothetical protein
LLHARAEVETWRRECNEERPEKALGGLTPADYAKQLKLTKDSKAPRYSKRGGVEVAKTDGVHVGGCLEHRKVKTFVIIKRINAWREHLRLVTNLRDRTAPT